MKSAVALSAPSQTPVDALVCTRRSLGAILADLIKARLTFLVLVTTLVGFVLGLESGPFSYWLLFYCMIGTALCASGAAALNQWMERTADARMDRTKDRPLPTGELKPAQAAALGVISCVFGVSLLFWFTTPLATGAALATILSYLVFYTPLKKISTLNTLVGAVPGALPPVIGYAASANRLDLPIVVLFSILFLWQLPHFLAISWLYREDYLRGGFRMVSGNDISGNETAIKAIVYTILLIVASILPWALGFHSLTSLFGALFLGLGFLYYAILFLKKRTLPNARRLFFASIIYLPILLGLLVFTKR